VTERDQRFFDRGQVVELGPLGPVGQVGWYVPRYVLDAHPQLATWAGLQDPALASLFAVPQTAPKGRLLGIDPSYHQFDEDIVRNLGLPLVVEFSGSEQQTIAALDAAVAANQPILVYWWVPTAVAASDDLVLVELPPPTEACLAEAAGGGSGGSGVDCGYPPDPLFKAASPQLEAKAPDVAAFLRAFTLSLDDQQAMLQAVEREGATAAAATQAWIDANQPVWKAWLEPPGP
jgi:glycine betaine/proline transport system substrate-binding protein